MGTTSDRAGPGRSRTATLAAVQQLEAVNRARRLLPVISDAVAGWAHVAARAVGVPTGLVSTVGVDLFHPVDEHNLPPCRWSTGQVPPSYAFCGKVIEHGTTLAVDDVRADPQLRELPVVRDTGARSFLGVPLRGPGGEPIGVLGLTDYVPRVWSPEQVAVAEDAAKLIAATVVRHQQEPPDPPAPVPTESAELPLGHALLSAIGRSEFVQALLDTIDANVMIVDSDGRVMSNEAMCSLGLPSGWAVSDLDDFLPYLFHGDGRPMTAAQTPVVRALAGESAHGAQMLVRLPDGREFELLINARPIEDEAGRRHGAILVAQDVTQARLLARFHECEVAVVRILADSTDLGEVAEPVLGCVARALGAKRAEFWLVDQVGGADRLASVWPSAAPEAVPSAAPEADPLTVPLMDEGSDFGRLVFHGAPSGHLRQAGEFLDGIAGHLVGYVERRRTEELAVELSRTRDEFIALAGHTLRTPLTTIVSLTDLMISAGDELADAREELLTRVSNNAGTLRTIVEDLLDLAGLESGHINLSPSPVDLAELVGEAIEVAIPAAARAGLQVEAELPARLPVVADQTRLRQAVDNLLSNAVKYSPGGGRVRVRLFAEETVAELSVADEGVGIPEQEREQLFNRFFRGATAHERGIPGTGLGLALTRLIVELHGGRIALNDRAGPGATFVVRLPLVADPTRTRSAVRRRRRDAGS